MNEPADAAQHTLIDVTPDLALFRYWRDAKDGPGGLDFDGSIVMGTIAAIRQLVLRGEGLAVLPRYFCEPDLAAGRLAIVLPEITPESDYFRLVFRADDPRRAVYERLARVLVDEPLR